MSRQRMQDLPAGARFIGPDGRTEFKVVTPASEHPDGWVEVWNLSITDARAAELLASPGWSGADCDPRDGVFMTGQVEAEVEVLS